MINNIIIIKIQQKDLTTHEIQPLKMMGFSFSQAQTQGLASIDFISEGHWGNTVF